MLYPCAMTQAEEKVVNISRDLLENALEMSDGIRHIGVGIGSIMLLIVVIYYVISMLDGGKFQMKMLVPLLLFFLVCNFSWIAKPVLSFTTTITESVSEALVQQRHNMLNPSGGDRNTTVNDHYVSRHLKGGGDPTAKDVGSGGSDDRAGDEVDSSLSEIKESSFLRKLWQVFYRGSAIGVIRDFATSSRHSTAENLTAERLSFSGILCQLMSWICTAVSFCLRVFGIMMTCIVVVFGPITFAFAIMPGRASNVVSWFIRICQFSLYAPLCALIDTFTVSVYLLLDSSAGNAVGFLMVFAMTIANLVGLCSVPTIASMIIEGASGAVSLSQGLQTIAGAATMAGGGALSATAGMDNGLSNFMAGMKHKGIVGFLKEMDSPAYDSDGNVTGKQGFSGAVRNITAYGQGSLYGWNVQKDDNPSGNSGS